jgi:DHA2 family multidrug resistance protein
VATAAAPSGASDSGRYAHKWVIAAGVTLASVLELIDTSIVNVALNQMGGSLGVTTDEVAWVSTAYLIAAVIVLPMTGWLSTVFGRRNYFVGSIALFTASSVMCGLSTSLNELILFRVIQGIGGGALMATSQAILVEAFPPDQQTLGQSIFGIGIMLGPAIGPTLGGIIVDQWTWPWIFFINLPTGLIALYLCWTYVTDEAGDGSPAPMDLPGIVLIAVGLGCFQFVLERGEHYDWFGASIIEWTSAVAAVSLVGLVAWELHTKYPILNLRLLKDRALAGGVVVAAAVGVAVYGSIFALPLFTQTVLGYTATDAGWALAPGGVGAAAALLVIGTVGNRLPDSRWVIAAGALICAVGLLGHAQFDSTTGMSDMRIPIFMRGFGTGCMLIPATTAALASLKGEDLAQGSAMFNLSRQLFGAVGIAGASTFVIRRTEFHRARLVDYVTMYGLDTPRRIASLAGAAQAAGHDSVAAHQLAIGVLDAGLQNQAATLAYDDIFLILAGVISTALLTVWLLRKTNAGASGPA